MNGNFEEAQLYRNMAELEKVSEGIFYELDIIHEELKQRGKWDEFVHALDLEPSLDLTSINELQPDNYYANLKLAFDLIERHEKLIVDVEDCVIKMNESNKIPDDAVQTLTMLGISLPSDQSEAAENNENLSILYLTSCHLKEMMVRTTWQLIMCKKHIFMKHQ